MKTAQNTQLVSMQAQDTLTKPKFTDKDRGKIIPDEFTHIENQYLDFDNLVTKLDNRENELKLTKEIEAMRLNPKNLELKIIKKITNQKVVKIR